MAAYLESDPPKKTKRPLVNAIVRTLMRLGLMRQSMALLETTGRRSGKARVTPVTDGLLGDQFWIVTEHGGRAAYVRNIEADPRVRVQIRGRWRAGIARFEDDVAPEDVLRRVAEHNPAALRNTEIVRSQQTQMRVIVVDFDD